MQLGFHMSLVYDERSPCEGAGENDGGLLILGFNMRRESFSTDGMNGPRSESGIAVRREWPRQLSHIGVSQQAEERMLISDVDVLLPLRYAGEQG